MPKRCLLCAERRVRVRFLCGHLTCCAECAAGLMQCPMCRHPIPSTEGTPGGYFSSGSSSFSRRSSSPGPTCFQVRCRDPPRFDYRCPGCELRYSLCRGCARDWVCPLCNRQADHHGFSDRQAGESSRSSEKCFACSIEDAIFRFQCPSCRSGVYMLCEGCSRSFECPLCLTVALSKDLHPHSDQTSSSSSARAAVAAVDEAG